MQAWDQRKQAKALRILIQEALRQIDKYPDEPRTWKLAELALEKTRDIKALDGEWKVP